MKVSAYGDITITIVNEPFSIHLSNEAQQFPTDENRKVSENLSYYTDVSVIKGDVSNPNFTIGEIESANGITVSKNANRITFSVKAETVLPSDSGSFDIPVTLDGETLVKTFSWSCQKSGAAAKSVKITASSTIFKSSDGGETYSPDTITLSSSFQGDISFSKWQYSVTGGSDWIDIKTGTHGFTLSSTSLIVSKTCDLFTSETTSITLRCLSSDEEYHDTITIQKMRDGKDADTSGIDGRNRISFGSGEYQKGFFKNFNKIEQGYGEHTLTSKKQYSNVNLAEGFLLGCRDYKVGEKVTFSYDIMYTEWNFPTGSDCKEFWIGQRYTNSTDSSASGAWRAVTMHNLPVVGEGGCKLSAWYHVEKTMTIPEQADESIGTAASIQFYNSSAEKEAKITFRIKNVKLEYGEKATDWSPAPEDNISSIKTLEAIASKNTLDIETKVGKADFFSVINPDTGEEEKQTISEFMSTSTQNMYGFKREVKQQYDSLELGGVNLFVQNTAIEGKYLSSENVEIKDSAWGYSDYIDLNGMDYYIASGFTNLGAAPATCFYNSDKVFLSGVKSEIQNSQESKRKMLQIPDGAAFMRFSFLLADIETLKIEKGTKSTSYSPSPDDVAYNIKTVEEQTAEKFSWLVESGTSSTNFSITDSLIEAITGKFVIKSPNGKSVVIEDGTINAESITADMILSNTITSKQLSANSVTAEKIMADALKSKNYVLGESGSFLNLADGSFDSKYLKWDNTGKIIASMGSIAGWEITSDSFYNDTDDYTVYVCPGINDNKDFLTVHDKNKISGDEWPFYVHADGWMHCVYGDIGGWTVGTTILSSIIKTDTETREISLDSASASISSKLTTTAFQNQTRYFENIIAPEALYAKTLITAQSGASVDFQAELSGFNGFVLKQNNVKRISLSMPLIPDSDTGYGLVFDDDVWMNETGLTFRGGEKSISFEMLDSNDTPHSFNIKQNSDDGSLCINDHDINKCRAGEVCHYYSNDYRDCEGTHFDIPAFTSGGGKELGSLHTKINEKQIRINKTGTYCFQVRFGVNSGVNASADKRVEFVPFVNGSRQARYAATFSSRGNITITNFQTYVLFLSAGDVVSFDIAPVEKVSVRVQIFDIFISALDYEGKYE